MKKKYYKKPVFTTEKSIQEAFPSIVAGIVGVASAVSNASSKSAALSVAAMDGGVFSKSFMRPNHNELTIPALIKVYD